MPAVQARAVIRFISDNDTIVVTSPEDGEKVVLALYGGSTQAVEVMRQHNGVRVVIRVAAVAAVEFLPAEDAPKPKPSAFSRSYPSL